MARRRDANRIRGLLIRRCRGEGGYVLVTAILILAVMSLFMLVTLSAGTQVNELAERGDRWAKALAISEGGIDEAIGEVSHNRAWVTTCPVDPPTNANPNPAMCETNPTGEYQVSVVSSGLTTTFTSVGYYPNANPGTNWVAREVEQVFAPPSSFKYALYSNSGIDVQNNIQIVGDIFANGNVEIFTNATVCGTVTVSGGSLTMENGAQVIKDGEMMTQGGAPVPCPTDGHLGEVWTGGSGGVDIGVTASISGNVKAGNPNVGVFCPDAAYSILGGAVGGDATACGSITSTVTGTSTPDTSVEAPAPQTLPVYGFNSSNYSALNCYNGDGLPACAQNVTSSTAVSRFNSDTIGGSVVGSDEDNSNYAVWQSDCSITCTALDLGSIGQIHHDVAIVTNAPVDFGNTQTVSAPAGEGYLFLVISLHTPTSGTCNVRTGEGCSIYGNNVIQFDPGTSDVADGVAGLLYTPGGLGFQNVGGDGEGAFYSGNFDLKNSFGLTYTSKIERILGFGESLERISWQELPPPIHP